LLIPFYKWSKYGTSKTSAADARHRLKAVLSNVTALLSNFDSG